MNHPLFPAQKLLLGPGPSNVSARVLSAMSMPVLGHLDPDFIAIMEECKAMLRTVFGTSNEITFPVSGTGSAGMEFAFVNFVEPGDQVLVAVHGVFGQRMANLADRLGARTTRLEFAWGTAIDKSALAAKAEKIKPKLVCIVNGETSTGVYQDMSGLGDIAHENGGLLVVDCVTSLAGMPVELDAWGADVTYSGTQKCLSCPPGLSPVSVSPRALDVFHARKTPVPSFYLDLDEILKYVGTGTARAYHHTAPISMIYALHQALAAVLEEGLPARYARHREAAQYLIAKMGKLGFSPLVKESDRLHPLTTLKLPDGIDETALRRRLLAEHRIEVGSGLGPLAGQVWRIGLMGTNANKTNVEILAACLADLMNH
ncbi:MAG: alanine--glyoxylate aminotransferase family protein [Armatimonadota bacterium]|nr:alanine--glyoxylate aminotransferase family protein [Armatimonadota bacterium]